ncbi:uncharacterized protein LOC124360245 [Homalodisca vitripennis]|uniref:uncharacterized protein LOC124360245 n=1 Tax=Homalodisca vitripennis TaxID=197043 RepID=UPI001EEC45C4|nr:uncharacterized protein LOC124360245 [Homalodisca vitripennis]
MVLQCPPRTSIVVQVAQYGKSNGTSCPEGRNEWNTTCTWPSGLQYSLLQSVVEACHKRRLCRFHATPSPDPCPWLRNFVEVAYKCRPYEFRSKMACENEIVHLSCGANSRIAIYSASFGRTEYESVSCPQPPGIPEETCLAMYATETVMRICHGRRRCSLSADTTTLGKPCSHQSRMYLKVVYTCAPRKVLLEQYDSGLAEDELPDPEYDYEDVVVESESYSEWPNLAGRRENYTTAMPHTPVSPHAHREKNHVGQEQVLYALLALSILLISVLGVATLWLLWQRRQLQVAGVTPSQPKVFPGAGGTAGDVCQIDTGMDLINITPTAVTIVPGPHPHHLYPAEEVLTFTCEEEPEVSASRGSNTQYYYG